MYRPFISKHSFEMKKSLLIIAGAVSLWTLASCSSDSDMVNEVTIDPTTGVEVIHTPTEIQLGSVATRSAIESEDSVIKLGIFALAREKQDINKKAANIRWWDTTLDPDSTWSFCLMKNVEGQKDGTTISWAPHHYFYPITQFYAYDFYAYHPYVDTDNIDTTIVNRVAIDYEIDGTKDILWGRATQNSSIGYSAKYFRQGGSIPQIGLNHMLTRLRFCIEPGSSTELGAPNYEAAHEMTVDSIKIMQVQRNVTLTLANLGYDTGMSWAQRMQRNGTEKIDLLLRGSDGNAAAAVRVPDAPSTSSDDRVYFGESFLLFPEKSYVIRIWSHNMDNQKFRSETPLYVSTGNASDGFLAGKSYTIQLTVHGAKEIELTATLSAWDEIDAQPVDL